MKKVGEILKKAREEKVLSLDRLAHLTKIDTKYIEALEEGNYSALPSETFVKGFIRNLSLRLDLNSDEMVAIFRRDYSPKIETEKPKTKNNFRTKNFTVSNVFFPIISVIVFLGYLLFQFRAVLRPPKLEIVSPKDKSVVTNPISFEGVVDPDGYVIVGSDYKFKPDVSGRFQGKITLPLGESDLKIESVSRFDKKTIKTIKITVISQ